MLCGKDYCINIHYVVTTVRTNIPDGRIFKVYISIYIWADTVDAWLSVAVSL